MRNFSLIYMAPAVMLPILAFRLATLPAFGAALAFPPIFAVPLALPLVVFLVFSVACGVLPVVVALPRLFLLGLFARCAAPIFVARPRLF